MVLLGMLCSGVGCGLPFGSLPEVDLDTSLFERSGFHRLDLEGTWVLTNSEGQTRRAVFDAGGDLVSLELPSADVFEASEGDTVEILLTSFGALSIKVRSQTDESEGVITLHEFEGWFSDDGTRIQGSSLRVADDLSSSRSCNCRETWDRQSE
jgi:hypothetical protein